MIKEKEITIIEKEYFDDLKKIKETLPQSSLSSKERLTNLDGAIAFNSNKLNLPVQEEVWPGRTCTDGDTIIKTNDGTPIVLFSIPLRYMHSPIEVASYKGVESMIEILSELLVSIDSSFDLRMI